MNPLSPALYNLQLHQQLANSPSYNEAMADHYKELYSIYRVAWNEQSAMLALQRWRMYEARLGNEIIFSPVKHSRNGTRVLN